MGTRRAIGDYTFNGGENKTLGAGQGNTQALKDKDHGRLLYEYGLRSNEDKLSGIDKRNMKAVEEIYNGLSEEE